MPGMLDLIDELRLSNQKLRIRLREYEILMTCGHPRAALDVVEKQCAVCAQQMEIALLKQQACKTYEQVDAEVRDELEASRAEIKRLRDAFAQLCVSLGLTEADEIKRVKFTKYETQRRTATEARLATEE